MPPTITAVDNQDGTGVTITISGTDPGATNTLYGQQISDPVPSFQSLGTRVGDGTIGSSIIGYAWYYVAESSVSQISNLILISGTMNVQSVHYRCMLGVQAVVNTLSLSGVNSIKLGRFPWVREREEADVPIITISHPGNESFTAGTNARDDVGYPVMVGIFDRTEQDNRSELDKYLFWREKLARAMRQTVNLPGVPEVIRTIAEYGPVTVPADFVEGVVHSPITFRFVSREPRGIGA